MAENTSLSPEQKAAIVSAVTPMITSMAASAAVALATGAVSRLIAVNYKNSTMAGDQNIHPTKDETTISKVETNANETDGKLSQNAVAGVDGAVKANETEARALTGEATAADSGASALRTKAGASDIVVKALKMT
jgi:hypothetical protein